MNSIDCYTDGSPTAKKLREAGIHNTQSLAALLEVLAEPHELAEELGIGAHAFKQLADRAELLTINGLGDKYVDLLKAAGIHTKEALRQSDPFVLHKELRKAAEGRNIGRLPNRATVEYWIEQAQW